jgi:lysozyme
MAIEILRRRPPSEHIVTDQSISLIQGFEGLHLNAYPDPASALAKTGKGLGDPWTIGWGHTKGVKRGDRCTLDEANAWLMEDANEAAEIVRNSITVPLTAGEFAALVSMAYNFGYVPKSLKACLNGGITDKKDVMAPGSYSAALLQFPRNCRAQAKPMRGLYRRRLAEACVFSSLPWEDVCSPTLIHFKLNQDGEIDANATTSLEDTIMRARRDMPTRPDVSDILKSPWPKVSTDIVDSIPSGLGEVPALPIPDHIEEDELLLDTPAATALEPEAKGTAQGPPPSPAPARVPTPDLVRTSPEAGEPNTAAPRTSATAHPPVLSPSAPSGGHSGAAVEARPVPAAPPPLPPLPPPPKPVIIARETINPNALPTDADTSKNMADSTRMTGMVLVGIGTVVQVVTLRLGVGTAIGAAFFDLTRDPVVITLVVTAIVGALGWVTKRNGKKTFVKGVATAKGNLY